VTPKWRNGEKTETILAQETSQKDRALAPVQWSSVAISLPKPTILVVESLGLVSMQDIDSTNLTAQQPCAV
jgi:hypothetical protein